MPPESVPARGVGPEVLEQKGYKWRWLRGLEEDANPGYDLLWRRTRSNYLGMLRLIDDQLGRLLSFLESRGLRENTLIVYLSDHGDYFCNYGLIHKGVGMPEDLIRIPMVWSGAGVKRQGVNTSAFVSTADVMPGRCAKLSVRRFRMARKAAVCGHCFRDGLIPRKNSAASIVKWALAECITTSRSHAVFHCGVSLQSAGLQAWFR